MNEIEKRRIEVLTGEELASMEVAFAPILERLCVLNMLDSEEPENEKIFRLMCRHAFVLAFSGFIEQQVPAHYRLRVKAMSKWIADKLLEGGDPKTHEEATEYLVECMAGKDGVHEMIENLRQSGHPSRNTR